MSKDFIDGLKFAQTVCGWYEGSPGTDMVLLELEHQIRQAEKNGIRDGAPICIAEEKPKEFNKTGNWLE